MSAQSQWLSHFATLLIERERSLANWQKLVGEVIPGSRRRLFRNLIKDVWSQTQKDSLLEHRALNRAISGNKRFPTWWSNGACPLPPAFETGQPLPLVDTSRWQLPPLETVSDLADLLRLHSDDLSWLTSSRYHHYHEQWLAKRKGGRRLLESPKPLLKSAQRILLETFLNRVDPHESATGFRPGLSILDFARPHTNKQIVLKMDLANFFPSIGCPRIKRTLQSFGYREAVADALAALTTARSFHGDLTSSEALLYSRFHLPQGAPTSPALANLAVFRFDCRLAGLAKKWSADYTRYADDLLFSGGPDFAKAIARFEVKVMAIALEEGLTVNARKTRTMPKSQRQSAAGLILNTGVNARRSEYDALKAILHNCQRQGPESQNREGHSNFAAHLLGRVHWLATLNQGWGEKLVASYQNIDWS